MSTFIVTQAQAISQQSLINGIAVLLVNLIIGAVAIHAGARLLVDRDTGFRRAVGTALLGALIWALVAFFIGWLPIIGPILTLLVWIGVINWQYPGGWGIAVGIGAIAWIIAVIILYGLASVGVIGLSALGIPGA